MGKAIVDLFIEPSYPYDLNVNFDDSDGTDLEDAYACYFECDSIGQLTFSKANDRYELTISGANTDKLLTTLEDYTVYAIKTADSSPTKLLSGRIHIDNKVRT